MHFNAFIGVCGLLCVLLSYIFNTKKPFTHIFNIIGSALLGWYAYSSEAYILFMLEIIWCSIGIYRLFSETLILSIHPRQND
jgi:hypothetical protein